MIRSLLALSAAVLVLAACVEPPPPPPPPPPAPVRVNPFFEESTLPYQAPDFTKITDADFQPALEEGMKRQAAEIAAIADNPEAPTFENTFVALEKSGRMLERTQLVFSALSSANTNDTLQKVQEDLAPKFAAHRDAIFLNAKLFARVKAIYDARDSLNLDPEAKRLVEVYYQQFVLAGATVAEADKARLMEINARLSTLETAFTSKLLAAAKEGALVVDDAAKLKGLTDAEIAAAAEAAKARGLEGKWVLSLQNTTRQPKLQELDDREVRAELFERSTMRAERGDANDTRAIIAEIAKLRAEKAKMLGFENYSALALADQMAKTPEAVNAFLAKLVPATVKQAKSEAADIQKMIKKTGGKFKPAAYDWEHYAEMVRKAKYDLDEDQIKPYFEYNTVLEKGVLYAATQLYGITFKERHDIPVYAEGIRVFEVFDEDGSAIGLMYFDPYKRDNKFGGAWMSNFVNQSKLNGTKPVVFNVFNFTKPAAGQPMLISFDDVTTMFHEFGHGLHGLLANCVYPTLSGTAVSRDFVEFPSQFNEHWALYPSVFANYAVRYDTKEPMPAALVAKIKKASKFNQGYDFGEILAASKLDLAWHMLSADAPLQDVDAFEAAALKKAGLAMAAVPPRYRSSYFLHIWANGYASGYYAYQWAEMLDHDAFYWFMAHGGLTRENGDRLRKMVLSRGNSEDLAEMYKAFAGRNPSIKPLLIERGLVKK